MRNFHAPRQPLDSRQLLAFVTLARTRNFTVAGKELFLSQSAISHALKALEGDIRCRLVDRVGKKIHLTPAGENFLHHAEKILAGMNTARDAIAQLAKWGKGRLRVAASESIRQYLLPGALTGFHREVTDCPVSIHAADTRQSVELLRQKHVDLAIGIAPHRTEPVDLLPLFTDELAWVVFPGHDWAKKGSVTQQEIATQKLILYSTSSYTFHLLEKYFQHDGLQPKLFLELGSVEAIKEMVRSEHGVTILPEWTVRREVSENALTVLPLGKRKLKRNWCVLRSPDHTSGHAGEILVKHLVQAAQTLRMAETN